MPSVEPQDILVTRACHRLRHETHRELHLLECLISPALSCANAKHRTHSGTPCRNSAWDEKSSFFAITADEKQRLASCAGRGWYAMLHQDSLSDTGVPGKRGGMIRRRSDSLKPEVRNTSLIQGVSKSGDRGKGGELPRPEALPKVPSLRM